MLSIDTHFVMEPRQEDSIQQLILEMRQQHADEMRRLEENREADLRMMSERFEDLVLQQETGRSRGSQDLDGRRMNSGGSFGDGPATAGDGIPNLDVQVATGETSRISSTRIIKAPPPPFSGNETDWGSFKDDFTTFAQYHGFAYVLTSRRHIKFDVATTVQSVIAAGSTREQYDDALNAWYALKQSAKSPW